MDNSNQDAPAMGKRVVIAKDGPYLVFGDVPLVSKTQVVSEYGEPLTWQKTGTLARAPGEYHLCRCGQSCNKPFCDDSHRAAHFDGTESADEGLSADREMIFRGGTRIVVKKDPELCMDSGFCGMRETGMGGFVAATADTKVRSLVIAMVERCPSGALTYRIEAAGPDIEPDLPQQIADTTEITSDGPIAGPLWVTGCVPVQRADGEPFDAQPRHAVQLRQVRFQAALRWHA